MTDEQIKQNAEAYADVFGRHMVDYYGVKDAYIAGAHSRDEEINKLQEENLHMESLLSMHRKMTGEYELKLQKLRNPWISVKDRLPEEEMNNISIPVAAITNEGYWFKGQYDYDNKEWFFSEDPDHLEFETGEFVTYWMSIPNIH